MSKNNVLSVRKYGKGTIEKVIYFKTDDCECQEIRVNAFFEGTPSPEQIARISEVIEKAAEEIEKIVEE